jgi:hypothetical protein
MYQLSHQNYLEDAREVKKIDDQIREISMADRKGKKKKIYRKLNGKKNPFKTKKNW